MAAKEVFSKNAFISVGAEPGSAEELVLWV